MKRLCKSFSLIFLMMVSFFGFAEVGNAYCVHNNSSITISVDGDFCFRCYLETLHSGDSGCCPGADAGCRGTTMIYVSYDAGAGTFLYPPCAVTAHGDVYISGTAIEHLSVTVYDDNGNQICAGPMKCCNASHGY